jgi:hypothetical protein
MDLILCSGQRASEGRLARDALAAALSSGTLNAGVFDAALTRIIALRTGLAR